jgi:hypothetical protein
MVAGSLKSMDGWQLADASGGSAGSGQRGCEARTGDGMVMDVGARVDQ